MDKSLCNPRKSVADLDFRSSSRVLLRACSACPILPKDSPIRKIRKMPASPEQLLLQLFVIFVAAKLLGELFERLRLPAVPGEILAGVALGPYAISVIPASDRLHSIAEGAIFVLFSAGLETSPHELIQVSRKALLVSVAGVIAPFVLGFAYLKLRGDTNLEATFVAAANGRDQRRHNCSSTVRHERVIDSYSEDHSGSSGFR